MNVRRPDDEQLAKLPRYVRDYITDLERNLDRVQQRVDALSPERPVGPISWHASPGDDMERIRPLFLPDATHRSGIDYSYLRVWMNGSRYAQRHFKQFLEIQRGQPTGNSRHPMTDIDSAITVTSNGEVGRGTIAVLPISPYSVAISYRPRG